MRSGRREIYGDLRAIMREFEPVTYISTSRSSKRYLLPSRDSPTLRPAYITFTVTSSDSIISQHQLMIALAGPVKSSQPSPFPTWFMTHDLPRKKSH